MKEDRSPQFETVEGPAGAIHVDDGGSGGIPVVFVHAFGGDTEHWAGQLAHLRSERRAVAIDLRGHGRSAVPATDAWSVQDFAADIDAAVRGLGIERFVLVGHSLGGAAALAYAGQHPDKVAGLVLEGTPGKAPPDAAQQIMSSIEASYDSVMQGYWNQLLTNAQPQVRDQVQTGIGKLSQSASIAIIRGVFDNDPLPALAAYPGPKLAVVTTSEEANPMALHHQSADLPHKVVSGTSHWAHLDKPEEFNRILDEFLDRIS